MRISNTDYPEAAMSTTLCPLVDAHTHVHPAEEAGFLDLHRTGQILSLVSTSTPEQWERISAVTGQSNQHGSIFISFGVHPWDADKGIGARQEELLSAAAVIGEIGLDTVWADIPLKRQLPVFLHQIGLAARSRKPVILHTKGAEEEIAHILAEKYKESAYNVAIHWYSGPDGPLERLIDLGCYFTLAADIAANHAQQQVARLAPANRLLTETDGLDAIHWATGNKAGTEDIPGILQDILATAARLRQCGAAELRCQVYKNFQRFTNLNPGDPGSSPG
jgi:TatD DNase family protein